MAVLGRDTWVWHTCFAFFHIWHSIASGRVFFYTVNNPSLFYSGAFKDCKSEYLSKLRPGFVPKGFAQVGPLMQLPDQVDFPVIAKPDSGVTGLAIQRCDNIEELNDYLSRTGDLEIRIEEFLTAPMEFGLMFYYFPKTGDIELSLVEKRYPRVKGDGNRTLETLIDEAKANNRRIRIQEVKKRFADQLDQVIANEQVIVLDYVGNASNGSTFHTIDLPENHDKLKAFLKKELYDRASICFTRMDIKANSLEDVYNCDFVMIEHNGVKSDPLQIHIKELPYADRYKYYRHHWRVMREISNQQRERGYRPASFRQGIKEMHRQGKLYKKLTELD